MRSFPFIYTACMVSIAGIVTGIAYYEYRATDDHSIKEVRSFFYPHSNTALRLLLDRQIPISINSLRSPILDRDYNILTEIRRILKNNNIESEVRHITYSEFLEHGESIATLDGIGKPIVINTTTDGVRLINYPYSSITVTEKDAMAMWPRQCLLILDNNQTIPSNSLTIKPPMIDLGAVKQGHIVEYSLNISNSTDNAIILKSVTTSCGCTAAFVPLGVLQPGSNVSLDLTFHAEGKMGLQEYTCILLTNSGQHVVKIYVYIDVETSFNPTKIDYNVIYKGSTKTRKITFMESQGPIRIERVIVPSHMSYEIRSMNPIPDPVTPNTNITSVALSFTANNKMESGLHNSTVRILYRTHDGDQHVAEIPATAHVLNSSWNKILRQLNLIALDPKVYSGRVILRPFNEDDLINVRLHGTYDCIKYNCVRGDAGNEYLEIVVDASAKDLPKELTFVLESEHSAQLKYLTITLFYPTESM